MSEQILGSGIKNLIDSVYRIFPEKEQILLNNNYRFTIADSGYSADMPTEYAFTNDSAEGPPSETLDLQDISERLALAALRVPRTLSSEVSI